MADDGEIDLFDVFEGDKNEDKMKLLETAKEDDAKTRASNLLAAMRDAKPTLKRPLSADAEKYEIVEKEQKLEESADGNSVEIINGNVSIDSVDLDEGAKIGAEDMMESIETLPRIQVHKIETQEKCIHEVAIPPGKEYKELSLPSTAPARDFPFVLDPFQKEAILCLDNYQSVLVSAHTSAGKTVLAQYAIGMSLRDQQRVIYTSPIKALSNQKYRELQEEFKDVGLMTGDVTINPNASCLVMTTEILRSMLYRGSEVMREVGWVIFDEIHYMRDKERGVVWEEAIILLPDNVHYVFLSATIPNARQFAEWVCFLHNQSCHVVYTEYRPVPLQHYVFPAGGDGLYEVVSVEGKFNESKFDQAMTLLRESGDKSTKPKFGRKGGMKGESEVVKIIHTIHDTGMMPVICFSFSRKECEAYATNLKNMDFNDADEKKLVREIYNNAIDVLSEEDKKLPQLDLLLPLLERGIGIHHSGLLPILKETIEILFGEGLLKTLFATETFSMGLNMPARTVLFTAARKFDGKDHRWITSGEYIQMSGRAGRRGKDDKGLVILMVDEQMASDSCKNILLGKADPLNSQFRLTYNMVLNLLRVEGINPEFMLERSFFQFQNYSALPELYSKVKKAEDQFDRIKVERELEISGYYQIERQIESLSKDLLKIIMKPQYVLPFMVSGRVVRVRTASHDFGYGVVVNYKKVQKMDKTDPTKSETVYVMDVLLHLAQECIRSMRQVKDVNAARPPEKDTKGVWGVLPCLLNLIEEITAVRLKLPENMKDNDKTQAVGKTVQEVQKRFPEGIPQLDPVEDMQIGEKSLKEFVLKLSALNERKKEHPLTQDKSFAQIYETYKRKLQAEDALRVAKAELKKAKSLLQMDELKNRKRVLRRLGYADESDVITKKGRVACEISAADELLLTELIFGGVFKELSVQNCASLLSCFVFQENADSAALSDELSQCLRQMQQYARRIAKVTQEAKMDIDEEEYVDSFRPHLMDVVHKWCSGATFAKILESTSIFEGSIIRALRRLEELLREMTGASRSIGDEKLEQKFQDAIERIKRDIVFAASLYL